VSWFDNSIIIDNLAKGQQLAVYIPFSFFKKIRELEDDEQGWFSRQWSRIKDVIKTCLGLETGKSGEIGVIYK
jgi:hypothetical protein